MAKNTIIKTLFENGLGEYFMLHTKNNSTVLGKLTYNKGKVYLKDSGLLAGIKTEVLKSCWDKGLIGMVCKTANSDWESLTFHGLKKCNLPVDLESTRHGFMMAAQNQYGDSLIDFTGSIYRGFDLMLQNNFLPVVLLNKVQSLSGETGLVVSDLRTAPMPIRTIQNIHDAVRQQVDERLSMVVQDESLNDSDFEGLFRQFLDKTA